MGDSAHNDNDDQLPEFRKKHFWWFVSIAGAIIVFVFGFYVANFPFGISADQNSWGTFGDFIGGILNPLLAFMGLIALLYTIIIQSTELKETRKELNKSSKALNAQSESLKLQNFETTLFNLLNKHTETISFLTAHNGNLTGYQVIKTCIEIINSDVNSKSKKMNYLDALTVSTSETIDNYDLGRLLNESLDMIDFLAKSDSNIDNKIDLTLYVNILKRQYSKYELMLFYLYMFLNKNETYETFFKKHHFFSDLKKSLINELLENIHILCGDVAFNDTSVDFIYLSNDESSKTK